ncbi:MAG: DNA-processing protein DprA, partial [Gemmatimonadetes bacterium]|nr:DNA-processing protein DprA [Gemmatimonadota bacterium]
ALYRRVRQAGLLTTEFAPAVRPAPGFFPRRNRIIAALADAVVVVQAGGRSGALITAGHALDIGREVLAVPGPVGLAASEGVHALLRDGAAVATSASDIIDLFSGRMGATPDRPTTEGSATRGSATGGRPAADVPETMAEQVLRRLSGGPATADEILRALDRPVPEVLSVIGSLELEGILRREADGRYVLSQRAGARA